MTVRFGPSGNSDSFYEQGYTSTIEQFSWIRAMGLDAYEYSFGRGVRIKETTARELGKEAEKYNISLSVHAPYYINLSTTEEKNQRNNLRFFVETARAADWMGANRVIFHPGVAGDDRKAAFERIKNTLPQIIKELDMLGLGHITLCPETMGKISQIGDLEETIELCLLDERLVPCIDFGHLHARSLGEVQGYESYCHVVDTLHKLLGQKRARAFHVHFSRIEFTKAGERKHWNYSDEQYGPDFEPLARVIAEKDLEPVVICESRNTMAEDAKTFREIYLKIREQQYATKQD